MSANPTRMEWEATADPGSPLQEGNRVLESIAQQEALRALLAFSDLHEQIRNRRLAGHAADHDLFETERFILDEVLQLICARAQALTQADGIVVALAEASSSDTDAATNKDKQEFVCRASAGPLAVERGVRLINDSEFLQDCLASGAILRCDEETDPRVELDFARTLGARSTVLVPLRGRREQIGVLQAFSTKARAFTDHDIRSLDLFAELVLSALKPDDQDRRINWLSDVAGEVLGKKPVMPAPVAAPAAPAAAPVTPIAIPEIESPVETGLAPSPAAAVVSASSPVPPPPQVSDLTSSSLSSSDFAQEVEAPPVVIPAAMFELPELDVAEASLDNESFANESSAEELAAETSDDLDEPFVFGEVSPLSEQSSEQSSEQRSERRKILPFPYRMAPPGNTRPGLTVVLGLVAIAALFSAGAWWGMQVHGKVTTARTEANNIAAQTQATPQSVTAPAPPADVLSVSDNLMSPGKVGSDSAQLTPVPESKLSALPKITGVRHWSSSMGSTVVIDMEDNVPYEVHRLMSPERIYFDLHDTVLAPELDGKTMDVGDASLTRVRVAQPVAGVTRIVLDTRDGSNFSVSMESSPYRLVVELRGTDKAFAKSIAPSGTKEAAKAAPVAVLEAKASSPALPARTGKFRIVLDAGHGGWDLGTVGRQGLLEKDLVLDVTQRLGKLLQARLGSDVMFTRSSDSYLPLDQRADFANQAQADLFVSVHANYSSSAAARGVETYYTNLFAAPGSKEAEKQNDGAAAKLTPVSLSAGGLHEKIEESRRLASSVQRSLYATLAASSPDIRNRGIKDASYVVLTGTTMPSILTEISFVSSPEDEKKLQNPAYRQQIAEALYKGIAGYQQTAPHSKIAQLQKLR